MREGIPAHCRYENGGPIITATTIKAVIRSVSMIAQYNKGRTLSKRIMDVKMQYSTAMQVLILAWSAIVTLNITVYRCINTTVMVPIKILGGLALILTISAMKLAVRPMTAISAQN